MRTQLTAALAVTLALGSLACQGDPNDPMTWAKQLKDLRVQKEALDHLADMDVEEVAAGRYISTGDNDHRVNPAHSRKMTAALQAATASGRPILLLTNAHAGHGVSTNVSEALQEGADAWAFLFANLGMSAN